MKFFGLIYNHPFNNKNKLNAVMRFVKWQLFSRVYPFPLVYLFKENSKLLVKNGLTVATGNLYCGLMEYDVMGFLLHFLRPVDVFVGANIGSYSVLASGKIKALSIAIEPIPNTFKQLSENISLNDIHDKVIMMNIGVGGKEGKLMFTNSLYAENRIALPTESNTIEIEVSTLDSLVGILNALLVED